MIGTPDRNTTSAASGSAMMLNSADAVVFPSPTDPPIRQMCEIRAARCGYRRSSSATFVSGPIGAIATGSGLSASEAGHERDGTLGQRACRRRVEVRVADAALAVDLGRADDRTQQRAGGTFRHRHVVAAEGVQQAERVLRAAGDVRVAAHGGHGEQPDLG